MAVSSPNYEMKSGDRWCAEVRTTEAGMAVSLYESAAGTSWRIFDDEFEARGFAAAHQGRFGILRDRGKEKRLAPAHYFVLIEDYRWHGV